MHAVAMRPSPYARKCQVPLHAPHTQNVSMQMTRLQRDSRIYIGVGCDRAHAKLSSPFARTTHAERFDADDAAAARQPYIHRCGMRSSPYARKCQVPLHAPHTQNVSMQMTRLQRDSRIYKGVGCDRAHMRENFKCVYLICLKLPTISLTPPTVANVSSYRARIRLNSTSWCLLTTHIRISFSLPV